MKLTRKKIEENQDSICRLLRGTEREGIDDLIVWLEEETDFFTAPASSKTERHGCYEGGLADHSANVYSIFRQKAVQFSLDLEDDEIVIASLLHDLCKANFYTPNTLKNGKVSEAKPYSIEEAFPMGHGEKSAYLAAKYIPLTDNEALLIRWHMGPFEKEWEFYGDKVKKACPAIIAFHNADHEASTYLDGSG